MSAEVTNGCRQRAVTCAVAWAQRVVSLWRSVGSTRAGARRRVDSLGAVDHACRWVGGGLRPESALEHGDPQTAVWSRTRPRPGQRRRHSGRGPRSSWWADTAPGREGRAASRSASTPRSPAVSSDPPGPRRPAPRRRRQSTSSPRPRGISRVLWRRAARDDATPTAHADSPLSSGGDTCPPDPDPSGDVLVGALGLRLGRPEVAEAAKHELCSGSQPPVVVSGGVDGAGG
jgi:hypothetical protein